MQFSIFGVPFKCTKDMLSWEKIKFLMCVYWAQLWREMVLGFIFLVVVGIAVLQSQLFQILLEELLTKGGEQGQHFDRGQKLIDWYHSTNVLGWVGAWGALILGAFIVNIYIQYYTLIKKQYSSFDRRAISDKTPQKFWSSEFWKRWIVSIFYSLIVRFVLALVMIVVGAVLFLLALIPGVGVVFVVIGGVLLGAWYALYVIVMLVLPLYIALHGGTWGFVPVSRQSPTAK
jgi:hypothetical protein